MNHKPIFGTIQQCEAELDEQISPFFQGAIVWSIVFGTTEWTELYQIWREDIGEDIFRYARKECFRYPICCYIRNEGDSKATEVENRGHISHFLPPVKIKRGMGKTSESIFRAWPVGSNHLYTFDGALVGGLDD